MVALTARQTELRDALTALVVQRGFAGLSVAELAAELRCSKRSLYALATSKEQLAVLAVRQFFREATEQVDRAIARTRDPAQRVIRYLDAVATALAPASRAFRDDVAAFPPAAEIYERNTALAAARVHALLEDGTRAGAFKAVPAAFVAEVVGSTMRRITSGEIRAATGLSDAEAYRELARLVVAAVRVVPDQG